MNTNFQYVSVSEAAVSLGVTGGRIRQLLLSGDLPGHKLGEKQWAIPVVAIERYRRDRKGPGRPKINEE